jgi:hypothetical protein
VDGSVAGPFYNSYAAMPSLHVEWSLLAGIALAVCARTPWHRVAGAALPVSKTVAVVFTGNHFLLDAAGGVAVALTAPALSYLEIPVVFARRGRDRRTRSDTRSGSIAHPMESAHYADGLEREVVPWPAAAEEAGKGIS